MRQPGIEPGSIAWKATMLTFTPPTLRKTGHFEGLNTVDHVEASDEFSQLLLEQVDI